MSAPCLGKPRPRFSIVTAVYNVGRYVDEFLDSLARQNFPAERVEIIAVDDGSTDDSLAKLQAFAEGRPGMRVLTKPNGGQSSARNLGLAHARGEWVTFPDPDDRLAPNYLSRVDAFLRRHRSTTMVATKRLILDDTSGQVTDSHPLKAHFGGPDRLRDLQRWPQHFHGSAPAAFFLTASIERLGLRFSEQIRPNFEDGYFCCQYLLGQPRPLVGFVGSARYDYRKRADASSTLGGSLADPDRYTAVLRHGYLAILQQAVEDRDWAPEWLQNFILYELSWYFTSQDAHAGTRGSATGAVAEQFHRLMAEITSHVEPELITEFSLRPMRPSWRFLMANAYRDQPWRQPYGQFDRLDRRQNLVRLRYHFTGPAPVETFTAGGRLVRPAAGKIRTISYHDRVLMWERIVWLPAGRPLRVRLDGQRLDVVARLPRRASYGAEPRVLQGALSSPQPAPPVPVAAAASRPTLDDRLALRLARTGPFRRLFRNAWVLMDRIHDSDDSAERLFGYLRQKRRKINAWFVVERGTPDYRRLRAMGYRRIVPHGSLLWKLLMLNCRHLISSHADVPIMRPPDIVRLTAPTWQFTFLQHGVIKDDLSSWLNPKQIDLFVTSTPQEHASIVGDDSAYVFTDKEVRLAGLPRFDRLWEIGQRVGEEQQRLDLGHAHLAPLAAPAAGKGVAAAHRLRGLLPLRVRPAVAGLAAVGRGRGAGPAGGAPRRLPTAPQPAGER